MQVKRELRVKPVYFPLLRDLIREEGTRGEDDWLKEEKG